MRRIIVIKNMKQARDIKHMEGVCFKCDDCKNTYPVQTSGGTGYGYSDDDKCICYSCCGKRDEKRMAETGKATLYLTTNKDGSSEVTNWPGTLRFKGGYSKGRHNMAGVRYDVWFIFKGEQWHGVTYGDNTQICHCKRTKERVAA